MAQEVSSYKVLSLFSSAGIGELGIKACNMDILLSNELIKERCDLYKENYPETLSICGDIWEKENEITDKWQTICPESPFLIYATPPSGKLAVGVKYTKDGMTIIEHLKSIGYVLFHHRHIDGQHLFAVKGNCRVLASVEVENDRYKNINTTELYIAVDIDTTNELDAAILDSTQKSYTPKTRYDTQYASVYELISTHSH